MHVGNFSAPLLSVYNFSRIGAGLIFELLLESKEGREEVKNTGKRKATRCRSVIGYCETVRGHSP